MPGLAGCGESSADQSAGFASGDGIIKQVPSAERKVLPSITGDLLQGGTYDSRELLGMDVVDNVWGSWWVPCREEAPALRKVSRQTPPRRTLVAFGSMLPPSAVPGTMVVDREGRLAARVIDKTSYGTLPALVEDVLAGDGGRG